MCYQTDKHDSGETEDCLYLSVITPSVSITKSDSLNLFRINFNIFREHRG